MKLSRTIFVLLLASLSLKVSAASDNIKDYSAKMRDAAATIEKIASDLKGNKEAILKNKAFVQAMDQFGLQTADKDRIAQALSQGNTSVVKAVYASVAARELLKAKEIDTPDLDEGLADIVRLAAVAGKGAPTDRKLGLTPAEMADASLALKKKTEYSIDMLSWQKEEAETHVAVMKRAAELFEKNKTTPEEALVQAIMDVTGQDKDGAMKTIRKLRDCV